MTFYNYFINKLQENGMFERQAKEVVGRTMDKGIFDKWNEDIDKYSNQILSALWVNIKYTALQYIEENYPMAWFKTMFE